MNAEDRFREVPNHGLLCDLLWADPVNNTLATQRTFTKNKKRACAVKYGYAPLRDVLNSVRACMLIRGHEHKQQGFELHKWNMEQEMQPILCTLFSAPNYCGVFGNRAALIMLKDKSFNINGFDEMPAPYYLPDN